MAKKNATPCPPNCPKRNATCHSVCKDYLEWRAEKDAARDQRNQILAREGAALGYYKERGQAIKRDVKRRHGK